MEIKKKRDYSVKSFDMVRDSDPELASGVWDSEIKAFLDAKTLKGLFFGEDWVFVLCDTLSAAASSVPMCVYKKEVAEDGSESTVPAKEHPLNQLLAQPNEFQDYASFMYNVCVEDTLMGNAIIWNAPKTGQLMVVPADTITLNFDNMGSIETYVSHQGGLFDNTSGQATKFAADDILHIRRPNPSSLLWGLSPFIPGRKSILFNRYSTDYLNAFYLKGAQPSLALKLDQNVSEQSAMRLLKSFEMNYTGRRNQRRTLILPKGVDMEQVTTSIADQQLTDLIKMNRENILNILRVPKHALGMAESGSLGSEEAKQAIQFMWNNTIIPMLKRIQGSFNKFFSKELGEGFEFQFDYSAVPALKDDEIKKADLALKLNTSLTVNEVRKMVFALPPVQGGEALLQYPSIGAPIVEQAE
ncbi:MAG: phage portal protein, partial [Shewanella sp.]